VPRSSATTPVSKVLDSWALLAWIRGEEAAPRVRDILQRADAGTVQLLMSWINAGEAFYMISRKDSRRAADEFLVRLPSLPIRLVVPDEASIVAAARLKSTRKISYADGFAAALAQRENAALMTGDPELREMGDVLAIDWIGPRV
jgi:predicted nucleic acid-binding protein